MRKNNRNASAAYTLEGALFLPDELERVFMGKAALQSPSDYEILPGLELKDECSRAFHIASAAWRNFKMKNAGAAITDTPTSGPTADFVLRLLQNALGFRVESQADSPVEIESRAYPISWRACHAEDASKGIPLVIAPKRLGLDDASDLFAVSDLEGKPRTRSPFSLAQEYLNASEPDRWGIATNGLRIRLLRDSVSLTRPGFLEFNLEEIFEGGAYAEFSNFWRVFHASRLKERDEQNVWDAWLKSGDDEGLRVREGLRDGVTEAISLLANGFLGRPENSELRSALEAGTLSKEEFLRELLRLMYRFIFVFCLEERELLCVKDGTPKTEKARERYLRGYSLRRFRERSLKRRFRNRFTDAWESVRVVMAGLESGCPPLALPALGGLFKHELCEHICDCALDNTSFFEAMKRLRWATREGQFVAIDYRHMGSEELGSVYESLLELTPKIDFETWRFGFVGIGSDEDNSGNARKSSGSYYTPDVLVQELVASALDPVIEKRLKLATESAEKALLSLRVIDPACGSGHFLLAAARRIAEKLAEARTPNGVVTPQAYRRALRDAIQHCIYGVDLNPLAVELARMALWLEGFEEGKPLSFLDHHLKVGNSLLGAFSTDTVKKGIPAAAFKARAGDDAAACKTLAKENRRGLSQLEDQDVNGQLLFENGPDLSSWSDLETSPEDSLEEVEEKEKRFHKATQEAKKSTDRVLCDLYIGAFLAPKTAGNEESIPTSSSIFALLMDDPQSIPKLDAQINETARLCRESSVFHWRIEFPVVFEAGGFDCVLGNPPWDKAKIEDKKWFSTRYPAIAEAPKADVRKKMIEALSKGCFASDFLHLAAGPAAARNEKALFAQYQRALREAEAASTFGHLGKDEGGRFPLTGSGDTNLFAYFAELSLSLIKKEGRAGLVIPTGIVTDDATKAFAKEILSGRLVSLYDFENREKLFPIDSRYRFSLMTLGGSDTAQCVFYASNVKEIHDSRRQVTFSADDLALMNPNTGTCPIMRSERDMKICRKIYSRVPVLVNEKTGENPWKIATMRMFDMSNDSNLFLTEPGEGLAPLYEGKLIHQYDNRYATFDRVEGKKEPVAREATDEEKADPNWEITPRYWVREENVKKRMEQKGWSKSWLLGFRDISRSTDVRTLIASELPTAQAVGHSATLLLPNGPDTLVACLLSNLNSLAADFVVRLKQSSAHVNLFLLRQIPILPPEAYKEQDIAFLVPRVARLTRNSKIDCDSWLPGWPSEPWQGAEARLAIRCEIDAYIAKLYGLSREDLEFILDPQEAEGEDYPSVTFPGLKKKELARYGEYRTRRLVLEAWDKLEAGTLK